MHLSFKILSNGDFMECCWKNEFVKTIARSDVKHDLVLKL